MKFNIDSHKIQFHPHRVAQWLDGKDEWEKAKGIYPLYVEISPVGACNHRCTFCAVDYIGYKALTLDSEMLALRLAEMGRLGVKSVMFAGEGEPLLHKRIDDFVLWAKNAGMDVSFTTNATLLQRLDRVSDCTWIKASVNAGTEATYMAVHKAKAGDWEKVWKNLAEAVKRKGNCTIGVQTVLLPENENEVRELELRCEDAGVDYLVVKPYSQHKFSETRKYEGWKPVALPTASRLRMVRKEAFATNEIGYSKCSATPFMWAYLMASADLYSCSAYLLDDRFNLGNLGNLTFQQVWEGEKRRENWRYVREELDISECRVNCRMDKVNKHLAMFGNVEHVNFI